jgi:hypothetical protein
MESTMTDMNEKTTPITESKFRRALRAVLRTLVRLILTLFAGIVLGGLIYFGFASLYRQMVGPVQTASVRLDDLATRQSQSQAQVTDRLQQFNSHLAALENQRTLDAETIAELRGNLAGQKAALDAQGLAIARLSTLEADFSALQMQVEQSHNVTEGLQATLSAGGSPFVELQHEIALVRVMEFLNRSRLYLIQNNYGLAEQDVENARQILINLKFELPAYQAEAVDNWAKRLELVENNLPGSPVLASDDLEIAWQMVSAGIPQLPTPTPYLPSVITPTPYYSPTPYDTLTPTPQNAITSTPYFTITPAPDFPATRTPIFAPT